MFCTTSLCSPSRASILTGLYAHTHGVRDNFTELPSNLTHWPQRLREEGYETAYMGKWHMGEDNDMPRWGFDYFATHKGQGKYFDTEWNFGGPERRVMKGYYTTIVTDMALDWLKKRSQRQALGAVCGPQGAAQFLHAGGKIRAHVRQRARAVSAVGIQLGDKPKWITERLYTWHGIYGPLFEWRKKFPDDRPEAVKDFENMVHGYWGTILSVDDSIGGFSLTSNETRQLDNTIIVFMGDNGLLEGEHGMVDKRTAHEPACASRCSCAIRRLASGKVDRSSRRSRLMSRPLLELCGAKPLENIHGKSWVKLVREGDDSWRKSWFYEYNYEKQFPYTPNVRAVRTDEWKYIHYPHGDGSPDRYIAELYNEKNDPDERHNLIADPKLAGKVKEMQALLAKTMTDSGLPPEKDMMPLDAGIGKDLPDAKIR
jgi:arylsulfatase A-like enzyme